VKNDIPVAWIRTIEPERTGHEPTICERQRLDDERARKTIVRLAVCIAPSQLEVLGLAGWRVGRARPAIGPLKLSDDR
jgi:hypothetical protein